MSLVLYRKYRPASLSEIYGQAEVKRVISNALREDRLAHAYLFAGPRGTGKTSIARIIAKEIGIEGVDLVEIDAASHRGIDKIRELRETVGLQPTTGSKKLYILDEAHMLTHEAFNALLKTLEEPPVHVYFILCTTEAYRIPSTVMSRCQRLNFQRATIENIYKMISDIALKEGYEIDSNTINRIAELANGSYRDALVLLDKSIGLSSPSDKGPSEHRDALTLGEDLSGVGLFKMITQKSQKGLMHHVDDWGTSGVEASVLLDILIKQTTKELLRGPGIVDDNIGLSMSDLMELLEGLLDAKRKAAYINDPETVLLLALFRWKNMIEQRRQESEEDNNSDEELKLKKEGEANIGIKREKKIEKQKELKGNSIWPDLKNELKNVNRGLEILLNGCELVEVNDEGVLTLAYRYDFHRKKIEEDRNRRILEETAESVLGKPISLKLVRGSFSPKEKSKTDISKDTTLTYRTNMLREKNEAEEIYKDSIKNSNRKKAENNSQQDLIELAQEVFGGQLIE